jgi:hypothetical protein
MISVPADEANRLLQPREAQNIANTARANSANNENNQPYYNDNLELSEFEKAEQAELG